MHKWERRLADLAHFLDACGKTYFEPNLFRLNTNQFLTIARTVTFLIQKDKSSIPEFDNWYNEEILKRWSGDAIMTWAKDSRNKIEKEGDLELHSHLSVRLIYSYREEEDIAIQCERKELLGANIKRLINYAENKLPRGVADASVLKIERRWVANSLPTQELLKAFTYIYSRLRVAAVSLADHLGDALDESIPDATEFDDASTGNKHIEYVKFSDRRPSTIVAKRFQKHTNYEPPSWLKNLAKEKAIEVGEFSE